MNYSKIKEILDIFDDLESIKDIKDEIKIRSKEFETNGSVIEAIFERGAEFDGRKIRLESVEDARNFAKLIYEANNEWNSLVPNEKFIDNLEELRTKDDPIYRLVDCYGNSETSNRDGSLSQGRYLTDLIKRSKDFFLTNHQIKDIISKKNLLDRVCSRREIRHEGIYEDSLNMIEDKIILLSNAIRERNENNARSSKRSSEISNTLGEFRNNIANLENSIKNSEVILNELDEFYKEKVVEGTNFFKVEIDGETFETTDRDAKQLIYRFSKDVIERIDSNKVENKDLKKILDPFIVSSQKSLTTYFLSTRKVAGELRNFDDEIIYYEDNAPKKEIVEFQFENFFRIIEFLKRENLDWESILIPHSKTKDFVVSILSGKEDLGKEDFKLSYGKGYYISGAELRTFHMKDIDEYISKLNQIFNSEKKADLLGKLRDEKNLFLSGGIPSLNFMGKETERESLRMYISLKEISNRKIEELEREANSLSYSTPENDEKILKEIDATRNYVLSVINNLRDHWLKYVRSNWNGAEGVKNIPVSTILLMIDILENYNKEKIFGGLTKENLEILSLLKKRMKEIDSNESLTMFLRMLDKDRDVYKAARELGKKRTVQAYRNWESSRKTFSGSKADKESFEVLKKIVEVEMKIKGRVWEEIVGVEFYEKPNISTLNLKALREVYGIKDEGKDLSEILKGWIRLNPRVNKEIVEKVVGPYLHGTKNDEIETLFNFSGIEGSNLEERLDFFLNLDPEKLVLFIVDYEVFKMNSDAKRIKRKDFEEANKVIDKDVYKGEKGLKRLLFEDKIGIEHKTRKRRKLPVLRNSQLSFIERNAAYIVTGSLVSSALFLMIIFRENLWRWWNGPSEEEIERGKNVGY